MARDSRSLTDVVENFDPLTPEQQQQARMVVCSNAIDSDDAANLMRMLGIFPGEEDGEISVIPLYHKA